MLRIFSSLLFISLCFSGISQESELSVQELKANFYMISGSGGNMLLYANDKSPILIDDSFAPNYPELQAIISEKLEDSVKYLINTHWHPDHVSGNIEFGQLDNITIVAHEAVRKRMKDGSYIEFFKNEVAPADAQALPDLTFDSALTFHLDETKIELKHFEHAHTDGDIVVHFTEHNLIHVGDLYFQGQFPYLDHSSGGTYLGLIQAVRAILPMLDDETIIVPGHGQASNKAEFKSYLKMIEQVFAIVGKMNSEGKSAEEIANSEMMIALDKIWNKGFITKESITQLMLKDFQK